MSRFLPVGKGVKGAAGFLLAAIPALGAVLTGLAITGGLVGHMARDHPLASYGAFGLAVLAIFAGGLAAFALREGSTEELVAIYAGLGLVVASLLFGVYAGCQPKKLRESRLHVFGLPSEKVEFVVGAHGDEIGHAVRQRKKGRDRADVPDILVGEAMDPERLVVAVGELDRPQRNLERERQHRLLPVADVRLAIIDRDLVREHRILGVDTKDRAVRNDAIEAIVGAGRGDDDHLALGLAQAGLAQHQRVVVGEKSPEFVGAMGERQENVRDETGLFLNLEYPRADVLGQFFELRHRIAADRRPLERPLHSFGGT